MKQDVSATIQFFARNLTEPGSDKSPAQCARERGWLDAEGRVTREGSELVKALLTQDQTRSVFRVW